MRFYGCGRVLLVALLIEAGGPDPSALAEALHMDPRDLREFAADLCRQLILAESGKTW